MSFNPAASYSQGLKMGQEQKIGGLRNALAGQMQEQGFNPASSAEFKQLTALDPTYANSTLDTFNALDKPRKQAFFDDAQAGLQLLKSGNESAFLELANNKAS